MPRVILLAGPSGSGKSRLAGRCDLPTLRLDDFYKDGSDPTLPRLPGGQVDWDHQDSWHREKAIAAIEELCRGGSADVPIYDIAHDGCVGHRLLHVDGEYFTAEGIFAAELVTVCAARGLLAEAYCVRHAPFVTFLRRLARDLAERRKPPLTLLRRGWSLFRAEPALVRRQVALGCVPVTPNAGEKLIRALVGSPLPLG